ncbi:3-phosphoinositide dependent protein kinase-1 [Dipsacomyces acuminosporus]|nr:3-phosphoinositide dependent protein kinase-1 [Dipsacomyces acuminosporus]
MTDAITEMRERPRIPPKPANLRTSVVSAAPMPMSTESVRGLNANSDSPVHSIQSATNALNAAAATPETPQRVLSSISSAMSPEAADIAKKQQQQQQQPQGPGHGHNAKHSARKRTVADFEFGRVLGEGSYSTVVEATEKATGQVFAAKILDKRHIIKEKKIKYVNIERDILQALHHPFIVRLHYAFQDSQSLYFVIDLAGNGELLSWIRKLGALSEECARFYLAEIIVAVEYMHMECTLHRDIKPENILLGDDMHILVTDFGTAKRFAKDETDQRAYSFVGTAEYVSPELLTDKAADRNSDLWAVGCIAFQMFTGRPPFKGSNEYQTFQKVLKVDYTFPPTMPALQRDLVERILVLEPEKRLGSTQSGGFKELKAHPFFQGFDWQGLATRTPPKMAGISSQSQPASSIPSTLSSPNFLPATIMPPAIPPKPAMLRQTATDPYYDTQHSSMDGVDGTHTLDSFPATPDTPIGLRTSLLPHNLNSYQLNSNVPTSPVSPQQAPVHVASHLRPPPPPPPPPPPRHNSQYQQLPPRGSSSSYPYSMRQSVYPSHSQSGDIGNNDDIYNVKLNDHVPPPLLSEEMAIVESHRYGRTTMQQQQQQPVGTDYYSTSYRPPARPNMAGQQMATTTYSNSYGMNSGSSGGDSWGSKIRSAICCGR